MGPKILKKIEVISQQNRAEETDKQWNTKTSQMKLHDKYFIYFPTDGKLPGVVRTSLFGKHRPPLFLSRFIYKGCGLPSPSLYVLWRNLKWNWIPSIIIHKQLYTNYKTIPIDHWERLGMRGYRKKHPHASPRILRLLEHPLTIIFNDVQSRNYSGRPHDRCDVHNNADYAVTFQT